MRAPLLLALIVLVPAAIASHPFPSQEERLRDGAGLSVHLIFDGQATAKGAQREDGRQDGLGSVYEDTHDWSSRWDWTAAGSLKSDGSSFVELGGNVSVDLRQTHSRETTTEHHEGGHRVTTSLLTTTCDAEETLAGTKAASYRLEGAEIVLRLDRPILPWTQEPCIGVLESTDTHGEERSSSEPSNKLYDVAITGEMKDDAVEIRIPVSAGKTVITESFEGALPDENEGLAGQLCGRISPTTDLRVLCRASGTIEVRLFADPCDALAESAAQHRAELAASASPPAGADEAALLAWADQVATRVSALLADERAHQLAGCDPPMEGNLEAVVQAITAVRDAFGKAAKEGKLTDEGKRRLVGAERSTQLIGGPEATGDAAEGLQGVLASAVAPPSGATSSVSVHSPVALRAVSLDGRVVGWNATANRTEASVEGATSEGEPGGEQRLALPEGAYMVEIVEQAFARYLLAFEGPDGEEAHLVQGIPGRVTRVPVLFHDYGDGPVLELLALPRAASPGGSGPQADGEEPSVPFPGVGLLLLAVAAIALSRRI